MTRQLVEILQQNVTDGRVVGWPADEPSSYTGYMTWGDLCAGECSFAFMNTNRVVDADEVAARVTANREAWDRCGRYLDFGTLLLLVRTDDDATSSSKQFLVMDGQHRVCTMTALHAEHPDRPLTFHFKASLVGSDQEAADALAHFQHCVPSDPRTFFPTLRQNFVAGKVAAVMRGRFAALWRSRRDGGGDPPRPYLSNELVFGMLHALPADEDADTLVTRLEAANREMLGWDASKLGGATPQMMAKAGAAQCMLGFVRAGRLDLPATTASMPVTNRPVKRRREDDDQCTTVESSEPLCCGSQCPGGSSAS